MSLLELLAGLFFLPALVVFGPIDTESESAKTKRALGLVFSSAVWLAVYWVFFRRK